MVEYGQHYANSQTRNADRRVVCVNLHHYSQPIVRHAAGAEEASDGPATAAPRPGDRAAARLAAALAAGCTAVAAQQRLVGAARRRGNTGLVGTAAALVEPAVKPRWAGVPAPTAPPLTPGKVASLAPAARAAAPE